MSLISAYHHITCTFWKHEPDQMDVIPFIKDKKETSVYSECVKCHAPMVLTKIQEKPMSYLATELIYMTSEQYAEHNKREEIRKKREQSTKLKK